MLVPIYPVQGMQILALRCSLQQGGMLPVSGVKPWHCWDMGCDHICTASMFRLNIPSPFAGDTAARAAAGTTHGEPLTEHNAACHFRQIPDKFVLGKQQLVLFLQAQPYGRAHCENSTIRDNLHYIVRPATTQAEPVTIGR